MIDQDKIYKLFNKCLFKHNQDTSEKLIEVRGDTTTSFHLDRLHENAYEIQALINELPNKIKDIVNNNLNLDFQKLERHELQLILLGRGIVKEERVYTKYLLIKELQKSNFDVNSPEEIIGKHCCFLCETGSHFQASCGTITAMTYSDESCHINFYTTVPYLRGVPLKHIHYNGGRNEWIAVTEPDKNQRWESFPIKIQFI